MATSLLILRKCAAVVLIAAGLLLLYYAYWVASKGIWPQWRESGLSLSGSNMILNREWRGNELYLVVLLYGVFGLGFAACGAFVWRRPRRSRNRVDSVPSRKENTG